MICGRVIGLFVVLMKLVAAGSFNFSRTVLYHMLYAEMHVLKNFHVYFLIKLSVKGPHRLHTDFVAL